MLHNDNGATVLLIEGLSFEIVEDDPLHPENQ